MIDPTTGLAVPGLLATAGVSAVAYGAVARERALGDGGATYRVVLPAEFSESAIEQLVLGLHGVLRPELRRRVFGQPWLSLELAADADGLDVRVWLPGVVGEGFVRAQLTAALPGARLEPLPDESDVATTGVVDGGWVVGRGAGLLRTELPAPGLGILATGLRGLGRGERAVVQLIVTPCPPRAQAEMQRVADELLHGRTGRDGERFSPTVADRARAQRLQTKAARPLFSVSVRVLAEAPDRATASRRVRTVLSGFHAFATAEQYLAHRRAFRRTPFVEAVRARRRGWAPAVTLNSGELAALLSMTPSVARELGLAVSSTRQIAPPTEIPTVGRVVGVADTPAGERRVALDVVSSRTHLLCTGATGSGKSEVLLSLAAQDMAAGRAVVVIDPKGGLLPELLRRVPPERIGDVRVLDATNAERFAAMNVLEVRPGDDPERVCDDLVGVMHAVYAASWGQRTSDILKASLLTLVRVPGSTLIELPRLLLDDAFRATYIGQIDDPIGLGPFWAGWNQLSPAARAEYAGPVLNKCRDILLRSRLRNVLGQSRSTIDLDEILNHRGLLFCDLSKGLFGEEAASLLGSLLVARVWQATRRRAAMAEADRPDASLYIDEFQDLVGGATHFEEVLAQSRSLRLSVSAFTQHLDALPAQLRLAVLQNARSKLVFQTSAADARRYAREFAPWLTEADLRGLGRYEAACALVADGRTARPVTPRTLPAPAPLRATPSDVLDAANARFTRPRGEVEAAIRDRLNRRVGGSQRVFGRNQVTDRVTDRLAEHPAESQHPAQTSGESGNDYPGVIR